MRATDATELGYVGADVVIDQRRGPVILELNARPGLGVQLANHCGLAARLEEIDRCYEAGRSLDERISLGQAIGVAA